MTSGIGFVKLDDHLGDAFFHFDVLKAGGYYFVPRTIVPRGTLVAPERTPASALFLPATTQC